MTIVPEIHCDVLVIGAGAAGLSAALVLGRQQRRVVVIDAGAPRNGPSAAVHMFLTRDGIQPSEFLALGRQELLAYPTVGLISGTVTALGGTSDAFTAVVASTADAITESDARTDVLDQKIRARRVVLATGLTDVPIDIPGLAERFGRGVFHCPFCHGWESRDLSIATITHEPFDLMLAGYLGDRFSQDVVLCTDGPREGHPELLAVAERVGLRIDARPIRAVDGVEGDLRITFADGDVLQRQAIFHRAPVRQSSSLAADLGCELLSNGIVKVDEFQATTIAGVSAAGDMAATPAVPDSVTLVNQAAADGVRAAVWMDQGLFRAASGIRFPLSDAPAVPLVEKVSTGDPAVGFSPARQARG